MSGVPAKCGNPACGNVFESLAFQGSGDAHFKLVGFSTPCPKCGSLAVIGNGEYLFDDQGAKLVSGPPLTRAMMIELGRIANNARGIAKDAESLITEISGVSPELAAAIRKRGLPTFAIILLLFWIFKAVNISIEVDLNRLIDQVSGVQTPERADELMDLPPPSVQEEPTPHVPSNLVETPQSQMSRQVRRRKERLARKRASDRSSFA